MKRDTVKHAVKILQGFKKSSTPGGFFSRAPLGRWLGRGKKVYRKWLGEREDGHNGWGGKGRRRWL